MKEEILKVGYSKHREGHGKWTRDIARCLNKTDNIEYDNNIRGTIKVFYKSKWLGKPDIIVWKEPSKEILLLIEIEEHKFSPKRLVGDFITLIVSDKASFKKIKCSRKEEREDLKIKKKTQVLVYALNKKQDILQKDLNKIIKIFLTGSKFSNKSEIKIFKNKSKLINTLKEKLKKVSK